MSAIRFLQIHTLHSYTAALLNRDDSGLAKHLPYGGVLRTRISSQCLKRHWRDAVDPHALGQLVGEERDSIRSRELVTKLVFDPLREKYPEVVKVLEPEFQKSVYGKNADKGKKNRQTLLMGVPELRWLAAQAEALAEQAAGDPKAAKKLAEAWAENFLANIKAMRHQTEMPGGLVAALFGRMVTSDPRLILQRRSTSLTPLLSMPQRRRATISPQ